MKKFGEIAVPKPGRADGLALQGHGRPGGQAGAGGVEVDGVDAAGVAEAVQVPGGGTEVDAHQAGVDLQAADATDVADAAGAVGLEADETPAGQADDLELTGPGRPARVVTPA